MDLKFKDNNKLEISSLPDNISIKTTTLYHENTPNIDGLQLLNSIFDYSLNNQPEIKFNFYKDSTLWNSIKNTYPSLIPYTDACHEMLVDICTCTTPGPMQLASDCNDIINAGFTKLEYIESTGTQYIDTGFKPNQDTRVILEFNDLNQSVAFLFGSRITGNNAEFGYLNGTTSGQGARYGTQERTLAITHNVKLILDANKTNWTLSNGNIANFNRTTFQSTQNCTLFGHNSGGTITCVSIKVFSCKIYDNNVLIRDFIPAKDENNVVCLYDTVSGQFFYNQGTGDFIAGPEISLIGENITDYVPNCTYDETPITILNRVRVDIGTVSGPLTELLQYSTLNGFNDNYEPQDKPRLVGTWTINNWYATAQLAQAQAAFDGLTIVGDPNYVLDFSQMAVQVLDPNEDNYNPAVAIILQGQNVGTTMASAPLGHGRWFLTKAQAANITIMTDSASAGRKSWFGNVVDIADSNGVVSSNTTATYTFSSFNEFKYFTSYLFENYPVNTGYGFAYGCTSLEEVTLPSQITSIANFAFQGCSNLKTINTNNITSIGVRAFKGCAVLELSDISNVTSIGVCAFDGCTKVTFTTINASVTNIAENGNYLRTFGSTTSIPYLHFLSSTPITGIMANYNRPNIYCSFYGTTYKIYVGDGTSAENDNTILAAYQAASNWSGITSYLDTWYNYLHPQS